MKRSSSRAIRLFELLLLAAAICSFANAAERSPANSARSEKTGRVAIAAGFDDVGDFSEGMAAARIGSKWGFIDKSGTMVIRPQFVEGRAPFSASFSDGLVAVRLGDKWGFIDRNGKVVISPRFEGDEFSPPRFSDGLCLIREDYKYGYIDTTGKFAIAPRFGMAWNFSEGVALVQEADGTHAYVDKTGNYITDRRFSSASPFREGLASVKIDGRFGFIDRSGKIAIAPRFDTASSFSDGLALVLTGEKYGYIDQTGKTVFELNFGEEIVNLLGENFAEGLAVVALGGSRQISGPVGKFGFMDKSGSIVISPTFNSAASFSDGLASVSVAGKYGFIDKTGKFIIEPMFTDASSFSEGLARVRIGKKYGFIAR